MVTGYEVEMYGHIGSIANSLNRIANCLEAAEARERRREEGEPLQSGDPIEVLDLTVRSYNVLKREGVNTIGALIDAVPRLDQFRNLGDKGQEEVMGHIRRIAAAGNQGGPTV
jgi:DNA-directed RNA polymerase subunit alpha